MVILIMKIFKSLSCKFGVWDDMGGVVPVLELGGSPVDIDYLTVNTVFKL